MHYPTNPKYTKYSDFKNLIPYIQIETNKIKGQNLNSLYLIGKFFKTFFYLFFSGFFRGKGFIDGLAGFRAHILFSLSISLPYIWAAKYQLIKKKEKI